MSSEIRGRSLVDGRRGAASAADELLPTPVGVVVGSRSMLRRSCTSFSTTTSLGLCRNFSSPIPLLLSQCVCVRSQTVVLPAVSLPSVDVATTHPPKRNGDCVSVPCVQRQVYQREDLCQKTTHFSYCWTHVTTMPIEHVL